jgi:hypothetical protein
MRLVFLRSASKKGETKWRLRFFLEYFRLNYHLSVVVFGERMKDERGLRLRQGLPPSLRFGAARRRDKSALLKTMPAQVSALFFDILQREKGSHV